jgi:protein-disulfide isomerase
MEGTNHFLAILNFTGCVVLFFYSLFWLKGLCPMCFVYYLASGVALLCFYKWSSYKKPSLKVLMVYGLITSLFSWYAWHVTKSKYQDKEKKRLALIAEYDKLVERGDPDSPSLFTLEKSFDNFQDAPIRLSIFSDFQCPMCTRMANIGEHLAKKYKGKINIQYYFFPLDRTCNPEIKRDFHTDACNAAYLSACLPNRFLEIHDYIFKNQSLLNANWLSKAAEKFGVSKCYEDRASKEQVMKNFQNYKKYNVQSTPTVILNGRKIEGAIPVKSFEILLDEILKRASKK